MGLDRGQESYLEWKFGERVAFDKVERKLYGHDIGALPRLVKPLVGSTVHDAVVQPVDETELVELVRWARRQGVPLIPRGKASSGYGGVVPAKGGVVVDFLRMSSVISVDADSQEVRVQPGMTCEKLDRALKEYGLTLRLYPSSYPSSTVGGWLAQGGAGFGSYQYGYFSDNVVSAMVVQPDAVLRELSGDGLELVSEAEGITGFITEVTLKVQQLEDLEVAGFSCIRAGDLQKFISAVLESDLPVWSIMFINPNMAEMRNKAPVPEHGEGAHKVTLPDAYIAVVTYRARDTESVRVPLSELAAAAGAETLDDHLVMHEWDNSFKIMLVKRLGPSLVPAEVVVPVENLGAAMDEIESKVHHPVLKEGIVVRSGAGGAPEAVLLGFIPGDERKLGYNLMFALSLTVMRIARKHGGRMYGTGLYFASLADEIIGGRKADRLKSFKSSMDPGDIMNPGKVTDAGLLSKLLKLASLAEPLARPFGNLVASRVTERPGPARRGIPGDVAWYAYAC